MEMCTDTFISSCTLLQVKGTDRSKSQEKVVNFLSFMAHNLKDRNHLNFRKMIQKIDQYPAIFAVVYEDQIIALSAVQTHFYPESYARVLTRSVYHPSYRWQGLVGATRPSLLSKLVLPEQIKWCKDQGIKTIFTSVEKLRRRVFLEKWVGYVNKLSLTPKLWALAPDMYYTCNPIYRTPNEANCWQNCAFTHLDHQYSDSNFNLQCVTISEWKNRFLLANNQDHSNEHSR